MLLVPSSLYPSGPSMVSSTTASRTSSMVKSLSNSRTSGPSEQEALLSFALPSSSAERPSKSRRLTSLPSVALMACPSAPTTSTTSGYGLFDSEGGRGGNDGGHPWYIGVW